MRDLDGLRVLLDIPETDKSRDALLSLLLEQARSYLMTYCRVDEPGEEMMPVIIRMAAEDFGRCGGEGVSFRSVSGATESYRGEYSAQVMAQLKRFRRLGGPGC